MSDQTKSHLPLKSGAWGGLNRQSEAANLGIRFRTLQNCYVSSDGQQIRRFPGFRSSVDLTTKLMSGFNRNVVDAEYPQPTWTTQASKSYPTNPGVTHTLHARADVAHLHAFEFVRGRLVILGESKLRLEDIRDNATGSVLVKVSSTTSGATTTLTLNAAAQDSTANWNGVAQDDWIYIWDGATSVADPTEMAKLAGKIASVASVTGSPPTSIDINLTTTTNITDPVDMWIFRVRPVRDDATADANGGYDFYDSTTATGFSVHDGDTLTAWEVVNRPKPGASIDECSPLWVANRQRDFGPYVGVSPPNYQYEGVKIAGGSGTPYDVRIRRRHKPLPFRLVPEVAGDRIIMAAPGYGCLFQVPFVFPLESIDQDAGSGIDYSNNGQFDRPRCLGVPKACMIQPPVDPSTDTADYDLFLDPGGASTNWSAASGSVRVMVAYRDSGTGETGLASEPITIEISANTDAILIYPMFPGYLMAETLALDLMVFVTELGGETFGLLQAIPFPDERVASGTNLYPATYGMRSSVSISARYVAMVDLDTWTASDIDYDFPPPIIQQMPMGAKAARVIRGIGLYGGHLGTLGRRGEIAVGNLATEFNATGITSWFKQNSVAVRIADDSAVPLPSGEHTWNVAQDVIPPAYAGSRIESQDNFPDPVRTWVLDKMDNLMSDDLLTTPMDTGLWGWEDPDAHFQRWLIRGKPFWIRGTNWSRVNQDNANLVLPRGQIQFTELGRPEIAPAPSRLFLDSAEEEDVEAIGRFGNSAIICTRTSTYLLSWPTTPQGQQPRLVSSEFGCIAPNSMVEFDSGTAWMSERGPVAMTGNGLAWIGRELEEYFTGSFARYVRDSEGMMRHCWACHDNERGLVYFGLVTLTAGHSISYRGTSTTFNAAASDEIKSRFPCDEVLIWNYRSNAFSTWIPPSGLEVYWMRRGPSDDGQERVHFLAADNRIYTLDDDWVEFNSDDVIRSAVGAGSGATSITLDSAVSGTDLDGGSYVRSGSRVLIVDQSTGAVLSDNTLAATPGASATTVTLSNEATWADGDTVILGVPADVVVEAQFINPGIIQETQTDSINIRFQNFSSSPIDQAWVKAEIRDDTNKLVRYLNSGSLNIGTAEQITRQERLPRGKTSSREQSVRMSFFGASQIRLDQVFLEVTSDFLE